jgi:hypothetical protein
VVPATSWIHDKDDVLLLKHLNSRELFHVGTKEIRRAVGIWHESLFIGLQVTSFTAYLCSKIWLGEEGLYC